MGLYNVGFNWVADNQGTGTGCIELGLMQIITVILFSQYLGHVEVPMGKRLGKIRVFALFPVGAPWTKLQRVVQ